ncbi:MAG: hypothetical protein ACPGC9_02315, partial [Cytophagales bacterium]
MSDNRDYLLNSAFWDEEEIKRLETSSNRKIATKLLNICDKEKDGENGVLNGDENRIKERHKEIKKNKDKISAILLQEMIKNFASMFLSGAILICYTLYDWDQDFFQPTNKKTKRADKENFKFSLLTALYAQLVYHIRNKIFETPGYKITFTTQGIGQQMWAIILALAISTRGFGLKPCPPVAQQWPKACMIACLATFTGMYTSMNGRDQVIQEGCSYKNAIRVCVSVLIASYLFSEIEGIRIGGTRIGDTRIGGTRIGDTRIGDTRIGD